MCMLCRLGGCSALIPATILLTISFFVLLALQKAVSGKLKLFGVVITVLLWISALLVFSAGIYTVTTSRPFFKCSIMEAMKAKHGCLMNKEQAPVMPEHAGMHNPETK